VTGPREDASSEATTDAPSVAYYHVDADATAEEFLAVSKLYARDVVDHYGLTADVDALDWEVSTRAKRRAGAVRHRDGQPEAVSLTWEHFETAGWDAVAETIRHELVHVHLLNEYDDGSHGERFRTLAAELRTGTHCDRFADPRWWVVCRSCGRRIARYRRSKLVREVDSYQCGECGGDLFVEETDA
jgi:predicted SprT family Zn-dependent metalloprotease